MSIVFSIVEASMHTNFIVITYVAATFLPALAVSMRRMHDIGKYGIYALIPLYSFILACFAGDKVPNVYGLNPKLAKAQ